MPNEVSANPNPSLSQNPLGYTYDHKIEDFKHELNKKIAKAFDFNGDGVVQENEYKAALEVQKTKNINVITEAVSLFDYNNDHHFDEEELADAMKWDFAKDGNTLTVTKQEKDKKGNITSDLKLNFIYNDVADIGDYRLYDNKLGVRQCWGVHKYDVHNPSRDEGKDKKNEGRFPSEIEWGMHGGKGEISLNLMDKKNKTLDINNFDGKYAYVNEFENVNITNSKFSQKLGMYEVHNLNLTNTDMDLVTVDGLRELNLDNSKIKHLTNSYTGGKKFHITTKNGSKEHKCGVVHCHMQTRRWDIDEYVHTLDFGQTDSFLTSSKGDREHTIKESNSPGYTSEKKQRFLKKVQDENKKIQKRRNAIAEAERKREQAEARAWSRY